jgi:hypothetical protein
MDRKWRAVFTIPLDRKDGLSAPQIGMPDAQRNAA